MRVPIRFTLAGIAIVLATAGGCDNGISTRRVGKSADKNDMRGVNTVRTAAQIERPAVQAAGAEANDRGRTDGDAFEAARAATVYLSVRMNNGAVSCGSGCLIDEPGVVITHAQVVNMVDSESAEPERINVIVNRGTAARRVLRGKVIGVDRNLKIAFIRVDCLDYPDLTIRKRDGLKQGQSVRLLGFPSGWFVGDAVAVNKSTAARLLQNKFGNVIQVVLDAAVDPGFNGGPIVDSEGGFVGLIGAAGLRSSPATVVQTQQIDRSINGNLVELGRAPIYRDGQDLKIPVRFLVIDPLGRIKKIKLEAWSGKPGQTLLVSRTQPPSDPDDSAISTLDFNYDASSGPLTTYQDVTLPPLGGPGRVYYVRPVFTNGRGDTYWLPPSEAPLGKPLESRQVGK